MNGSLILVATPIGNLSDISSRMAEAFRSCDFIAAEDTRVTIKLLNHLGVKKPMISYYEHNMDQKTKFICDKILSGEVCVLVSDAGMPAISDPGEQLVKACSNQGIKVSVIPGPCAAIAAVAVSGLNTGRFVFEGFLTVNKNKRRMRLQELRNEERTMIFYEAPHKLVATLQDMFNTFGERKISLVRELTKIHEEIIRTTLSDALTLYSNEKMPKGEYVLVLEGNTQQQDADTYTMEQAVAILKNFIDEGMSPSKAAKASSNITRIKKGDIYKAFISVIKPQDSP